MKDPCKINFKKMTVILAIKLRIPVKVRPVQNQTMKMIMTNMNIRNYPLVTTMKENTFMVKMKWSKNQALSSRARAENIIHQLP